uniref:(California timema) hypothetical protein n=1 Tax=Timema californicum TaxID=61474 RepID=A0A7R9JD50_TIMCA|nr:unnamed protein product [Timema californicum]
MFHNHSPLLVLLWMTLSDASISTNGQRPVLWQSNSLKDLKDQSSADGLTSWGSDDNLVHPQRKNGPSIVDIILNRPVRLEQEEDAHRTKSYVDAFIFRQLNRAPKISVIGPFRRISADKEASVSPSRDRISSDQDDQETFSGELLSDTSYPTSDVSEVKELKLNTDDKTEEKYSSSSFTSNKDVTEQKHDKKEIPEIISSPSFSGPTEEGREATHAEEDSVEKAAVPALLLYWGIAQRHSAQLAGDLNPLLDHPCSDVLSMTTTEAVYYPRGIPPYWSPSILGELPVSMFRMPANEEYQLSDGKYTHSFIHGHTLDF